MIDVTVGGPDPTNLLALPVGFRLHEYEIRSVLGQGGFGITYLAVDTQLRQSVAIKEYLPTYMAARFSSTQVSAKSDADKPAFRDGLQKFLDEARVIARLDHPNIVQVRRFFELNGTGYFVMRHEKGEPLSKLAAEGAISNADMRRILLDVLAGLEAVHASGHLHRDIKPGNIIIRPDGSAVLIDFGAAREFQNRTTRAMTTILSPGYAPPEQHGDSGEQGPWTDFYALGATAYHCVTGTPPPDSLHRLRLARKGKDPFLPAMSDKRGIYDAGLLETIDRMLRLDEEDRPQTAAEIRTALGESGAAPIAEPRRLQAQDGGRRAADQKVETTILASRPRIARVEPPVPKPPVPKPSPGKIAGLVLAAVFLLGAAIYGIYLLRAFKPVARTEVLDIVPRPDPLPPPVAPPPVEPPVVPPVVVPPADPLPSKVVEPPVVAPVVPPVVAPAACDRRDGTVLASLSSRSATPLTAQEECALKPKDVFKECVNCPEMVVVPAGSFTMGSSSSEEGHQDNEEPQHLVTIAKPFAVGRFTVTRDEFAAFVADTGYDAGSNCLNLSGKLGERPDRSWRNPGYEQRGTHPVVCVNWNDAQAYVNWLNKKTGKSYRLLSESEWEYVARAGTTTPFWWGSSISTSQANYNGTYAHNGGAKGEYRKRTVPVDSFAANPFGLYNVHGNVAQWVEDCYADSYRQTPTDGAPNTAGECKTRVLRGGAWVSDPEFLRAARRFNFSPDDRSNAGGLRLARTITP